MATNPETENAQPEEAQLGPNVTMNDVLQARSIRALFSNRVYARSDGLHLRITFGESVDGEAMYHTSLVVPLGDALAFGQLITSLSETGIAAWQKWQVDQSAGDASGTPNG